MGHCAMRIGTIVSHRCGAPANRACPSCTRAICARHMRGAGPCLACAGEYTPSTQAAVVLDDADALTFSAEELALFDAPIDRTKPLRVQDADDS
jgi:hypothetical protein